MLNEYEEKTEIKGELTDGYYKSDRWIYKISGRTVFKIYLKRDTQFIYEENLMGIWEKVEVSTEEEWREAVANLMATIYLSLSLDAMEEKKLEDRAELFSNCCGAKIQDTNTVDL